MWNISANTLHFSLKQKLKFEKNLFSSFFVRLGEHDINRTDDGLHQDISVNRVVKHAQYHAHFKINDIGMIELKRDVTFSGRVLKWFWATITVIVIIIFHWPDRIRPICLPVDEPYRSREFNDANPFVAGWGSTTERAAINDSSNVLLQLQVPVVDNDTCRKLVFKAGAVYANIQIKDHVLCAGMKGGEGFWVGDSGGPLMLPIHQNGTFPYYQIGIVSFSFHAAKENVPDIYSRVQYHADWIKKQLEDSTTNETKAVEWKSNL